MVLRKISQAQVEKTIRKPDQESVGRNESTIFLRRFGNHFVRVVAIMEGVTTTVITLHWAEQRRIKENTL